MKTDMNGKPIGHDDDCLWATLLPTGYPNFWGCNCGYGNWELEHEDTDRCCECGSKEHTCQDCSTFMK
jgi:hypothetical protein